MTSKHKRQAAALDRLTEALVDDILLTPAADLLAEEQGGEDGAAAARAAFERANRTTTLLRLSGRQAFTSKRRRAPTNIRALDPKTARGWLDDFIACYPETAGKLAAAARGGDRLSDEDVYIVLEALQEGGVLEKGGLEGRR
jgi:hypothetical protein